MSNSDTLSQQNTVSAAALFNMLESFLAKSIPTARPDDALLALAYVEGG